MSIEGKASTIVADHGAGSPLLFDLFHQAGGDWTLLEIVSEDGRSARVVSGLCNYGALPPGVTVHYFHAKPDPLDHDGNGKRGGSKPRTPRK